METVDQVLREMREDIEKGNVPLWADFGSEIARVYVARLENAAIKREREAVGNAAKMRKELMKCMHYVDGATDLCKGECEAIASFMKASLAAPARNCDRFASCEDAYEAYRAYEEYYILRSNNVFDKPLQFTDWLFDEAKGETK